LESELQQAIEEAIQRLPETQRMALVLRRYEQLSYEQIAEVLDLCSRGFTRRADERDLTSFDSNDAVGDRR